MCEFSMVVARLQIHSVNGYFVSTIAKTVSSALCFLFLFVFVFPIASFPPKSNLPYISVFENLLLFTILHFIFLSISDTSFDGVIIVAQSVLS